MRKSSQIHRVTTNHTRPLGRQPFQNICDCILRQLSTGGGPGCVPLRLWEAKGDNAELFYSAILESHTQATILSYVDCLKLEHHSTNRKNAKMTEKSKRYSLDVVLISSNNIVAQMLLPRKIERRVEQRWWFCWKRVQNCLPMMTWWAAKCIVRNKQGLHMRAVSEVLSNNEGCPGWQGCENKLCHLLLGYADGSRSAFWRIGKFNSTVKKGDKMCYPSKEIAMSSERIRFIFVRTIRPEANTRSSQGEEV